MFPGGPTYQSAAHLSRLFNQIALYLTLGRGPLSVEPWGDEPSAIRSTRPFPGRRSRRVLGGLEHPRRRPTAATMYPGDANDAALSQARQKPPNRVWRCDQRIGARSMATIVTTDSLTICPPQPQIAWQPLCVVKPGPCRLRNFASGLSAPASLRTGFHICSASSPTKAPSGRAAIGPFRRAALRGLFS